MEMDQYKLEDLVEKLKIDVIMDKSATKIQAFFKKHRMRNIYLEFNKKRHDSATKIMRQWKTYRMRKLRDIMLNYRKNVKSYIIQKYMKGYLVSKKYEKQYIKMRLTDNI